MISRNYWLIVGGFLSSAAAVLHIAVIFGGPDWYRFFGAGEPMAQMAERGSLLPAVVTAAIALVLAIWAAYAFAGSGLVRRLPLMRAALLAISGIYLIRGLLIIPLLFQPRATAFDYWSSLIVLGFGFVYGMGTAIAWPHLTRKESIA